MDVLTHIVKKVTAWFTYMRKITYKIKCLHKKYQIHWNKDSDFYSKKLKTIIYYKLQHILLYVITYLSTTENATSLFSNFPLFAALVMIG